MRYKVVIPNWYQGILTCEDVDGKEVVINAPKHMAWAVGKPSREALYYYGQRPGATVEPVGKNYGKKRSIKIVRSKKRTVRVIRRRK